MTTPADLNARFGIPGRAVFARGAGDLIHLDLHAEASEARLLLQGAHLTHWAPHGQAPVLYLSPQAVFAPGKPLRGGVPLLFPWFGPRWDGAEHDRVHGTRSPAHGFARTSEWTVEQVRLDADGALVVRLVLEPDANSRALGYDHFRARLRCRVADTLCVALDVSYHGPTRMTYEDGLHTYFAVSDLDAVRLEGLYGATYLDKRDRGRRKQDGDARFAFEREVDRTYVNTSGRVSIHDPAGGRVIRIDKQGSETTVVWNPAALLTPGFSDLPADGWRHFVCVETVNADDNRLSLAPGQTHTTAMTLSVEAG